MTHGSFEGSFNPAPGTAAGDLSAEVRRASLGTLDLLAIAHGHELGLYTALRDGPATPPELAERTGLNTRMLREWLEHQAVGGILTVSDGEDSAEPDQRTFTLTDAAAEVFTDPMSLSYGVPTALEALHAVKYVQQVREAFRTGLGMDRVHEWVGGRPDGNRPKYLQQLATWLGSIPDVHASLTAGARIADLGVGSGWSCIAMAIAYPESRIDGFDLDPDAIGWGVQHAEEYGVSDRVQLLARDAGEAAFAGRYDLVTVFEALHDMAQPVGVLASMKNMLGPGGSVIVADERVPDEFVAPGTEVDRSDYGWSLASCLPRAMTDPDSVATGAVMRAATLGRYAREAGFSRTEVLPIDHFEWRFYRLFP